MRFTFSAASLSVALLATFPVASLAQMTSEVKFEAGNHGTMVSGSVLGDEYVDYTLGAGAGQEMFVDLAVTDSNSSGTVYFNILPPGSTGEAIYNSSIDGNTATVTLPKKGNYTIRIYQMGNDADTGKTSGFNIDL